MGYQTGKFAGKGQVLAEDLGPGQVQITHLDPALFLQVKSLNTHNHGGIDSTQLNGHTAILPGTITTTEILNGTINAIDTDSTIVAATEGGNYKVKTGTFDVTIALGGTNIEQAVTFGTAFTSTFGGVVGAVINADATFTAERPVGFMARTTSTSGFTASIDAAHAVAANRTVTVRWWAWGS